jgi:hypothetical protein
MAEKAKQSKTIQQGKLCGSSSRHSLIKDKSLGRNK